MDLSPVALVSLSFIRNFGSIWSPTLPQLHQIVIKVLLALERTWDSLQSACAAPALSCHLPRPPHLLPYPHFCTLQSLLSLLRVKSVPAKAQVNPYLLVEGTAPENLPSALPGVLTLASLLLLQGQSHFLPQTMTWSSFLLERPFPRPLCSWVFIHMSLWGAVTFSSVFPVPLSAPFSCAALADCRPTCLSFSSGSVAARTCCSSCLGLNQSSVLCRC